MVVHKRWHLSKLSEQKRLALISARGWSYMLSLISEMRPFTVHIERDIWSIFPTYCFPRTSLGVSVLGGLVRSCPTAWRFFFRIDNSESGVFPDELHLFEQTSSLQMRGFHEIHFVFFLHILFGFFQNSLSMFWVPRKYFTGKNASRLFN
jgi:hypothetical protein